MLFQFYIIVCTLSIIQNEAGRAGYQFSFQPAVI